MRHTEESEKHSTFLCHLGYFRSRVMQQGDCNAPAIIMKVMQDLLRLELHKDVAVYLDNILIGSQTYEEHVRLIRFVLDKLREQEFYLNKDKYHFITNKVKVLGHIITLVGLSADPVKIGKIMEFQIHHNRRMLQAFVGIVNYLGKFCPNLATVAAPLTDLQGSIAI